MQIVRYNETMCHVTMHVYSLGSCMHAGHEAMQTRANYKAKFNQISYEIVTCHGANGFN